MCGFKHIGNWATKARMRDQSRLEPSDFKNIGIHGIRLGINACSPNVIQVGLEKRLKTLFLYG